MKLRDVAISRLREWEDWALIHERQLKTFMHISPDYEILNVQFCQELCHVHYIDEKMESHLHFIPLQEYFAMMDMLK